MLPGDVSLPILYLVGAIRDDRPEDIEWREQVIEHLEDHATVLNPLAGKTYNTETKRWTVHGKVTPTAKYIFRHDLACVRKADVIVANMTALSDGYPSIGSLMEIGAAAMLGKLIYLLVDENYAGHANPAMFTLHPFLDEAATVVFHTLPDLLEYLDHQVDMLSGRRPYFEGYVP